MRLKPAAWLPPLLLLIGFGMLVAASWLTAPRPVLEITPTRSGQPERCLTCHQGIEPVSAAHPTEAFGCVSCHGGDRLATDQDAAHAGMVRNPGALETAEQYCGECHAAQVVLVQRSLMATYAGAIGLIRRSFGLQPDGEARFAVTETGHLQAFAPAVGEPALVQRFAETCMTCHLYAEPQAADYYYRSTGCSSCHVLYADDGRYRGGDPTINRDEAGHPAQHIFTLAIPYSQCNHCHNRGNYDLRTMTFIERDDLPPHRELSEPARRLHEYYQPISQFTRCEWQLDCIDCHTSLEVMGDSQLYSSRSQAQYIQCATCHGTLDQPPLETTVQSAADVALKRAALNPLVDLRVGDTVMMTDRGEALWHIQKRGAGWVLTGKATGKQYTLPLVTGSACQQQPDQQESRYCHQCHAYDREAALP